MFFFSFYFNMFEPLNTSFSKTDSKTDLEVRVRAVLKLLLLCELLNEDWIWPNTLCVCCCHCCCSIIIQTNKSSLGWKWNVRGFAENYLNLILSKETMMRMVKLSERRRGRKRGGEEGGKQDVNKRDCYWFGETIKTFLSFFNKWNVLWYVAAAVCGTTGWGLYSSTS